MRISKLVVMMGLMGLQVCGSGVGLAQDIVVFGGAGNRIPDGQTAVNLYQGTDFGVVDVASGSPSHNFYIDNLDLDTNLSIGTVTITGPNAADFTVTQQPAGTVILLRTSFTIQFNPSADGTRTAIVTVPSNDPDGSEATFNFTIEGTGTSTLGLAPQDLEVNVTGLKVKSADKILGKVIVTNNGPALSQGTSLEVYTSGDNYFGVGDTLIGTIPLKPLPANGAKSQTVKINLTPGRSHGVLFFRAIPLPSGPPELNFIDNQSGQSF